MSIEPSGCLADFIVTCTRCCSKDTQVLRVRLEWWRGGAQRERGESKSWRVPCSDWSRTQVSGRRTRTQMPHACPPADTDRHTPTSLWFFLFHLKPRQKLRERPAVLFLCRWLRIMNEQWTYLSVWRELSGTSTMLGFEICRTERKNGRGQNV